MSTALLLLLGPPAASRRRIPVRLDRKTVALLAYLSVTREQVGRATLAGILWPDSAQAGVNLRKSLWSVAHTLGESCLDANPATGTVRLGPALWVDVVRLGDCLEACRTHGHGSDEVCQRCMAPLAEAAALHRGEFLAGFTLRDSADFDDWQALHTQRLMLLMAGVFDRMARAHAARREFQAALQYAEQRVALDPLDEAAHRQIMQVLTWSGQRSAALRQIEACERRLAAELGIAPAAETVALWRAIQDNQLPPPTPLALAAVAGETPAEPRTARGQARGGGSTPAPGRAGPPPAVEIPAFVASASLPASRLHPIDRIRVSESAPLIQAAPAMDVGGNPPVWPAAPVARRSALLSQGEAADGAELGVAQEVVQQLQRVVLDDVAWVELPADAVRAVALRPPLDLTAYHLSRIAAWSLPRYRLDTRFVALSLLVDQGENVTERWRVETRRFDDLRAALAATQAPALVLLGRPGAGKSTLLRRLELDAAVETLRTAGRRVSYYVSLNGYRPERPGAALPPPLAWLGARWRRQYPQLPELDRLLDEGRMLLLLDGLNELPHRDAGEYHALVEAWKEGLHEIVARGSAAPGGNQVIFTCRSLDYSAPLSSPELPVPQARVEALSDAQIHDFLLRHSPDLAERIQVRLAAAPRLAEIFRTPYALRLLVDQAQAGGPPAWDWAGLCTAVIRRALVRELERGNPLLAAGSAYRLLSERDRRRIVQVAAWPDPYGLPVQGRLFGKLADLAYAMQAGRMGEEAAQVRLDYGQACALLADPEAEAILATAVTLGILEDDPARDEILFVHQLVQEYFAARWLASALDPARVPAVWRASDARVDVAELLASLPPSEPLPGLPSTGWEETTILAAAMAADPDHLIHTVAETNLPLAARAAAGIEASRSADRGDSPMETPPWDAATPRENAAPRVAPATVDALREALIQRSRDPALDPRARIAAGLALGPLGDPRLTPGRGPDGDYRIGSLALVPPGDYPIGDDAVYDYLGRPMDRHVPRHVVRLGSFSIGRFAVTNAEYACFIAAGGYEDERWWDSAAGRAWRRGEGTAEGHRAAVRYWWQWFKQDPRLVEQQYARGEFNEEKVRLWRRRLAMDAVALEEHLREIHPDARFAEPLFWRDEAWNNPAQPVVGICWFEARAYCAWLAAQSGLAVHLPTEVEWEAAARGIEGRRYPSGDAWDPYFGNLADLRVRRTTPVGVFPASDTPVTEARGPSGGISDLCGNSWDWTSSLAGPDMRDPSFRYPYDPADGREDPEAPMAIHRVVRGGAWVNGRITARADYRGFEHPCDRTNLHGVRIAVDGG